MCFWDCLKPIFCYSANLDYSGYINAGFYFFANVLDSLDKISNQISGLKEEKSPAPATADVPGSSSAAPDSQEYGQANQPLTGTNEWTCPSCGKVNQNDAGSCVCGKQKP